MDNYLLKQNPKSENPGNNRWIITLIAVSNSIGKLIKDRKREFSLGGRKQGSPSNLVKLMNEIID